MARHENEQLDFKAPEPVQSIVIYFTEGAEAVTEDGPKCYAKQVKKINCGVRNSTESLTYYVKFGRGKLFDPWGTYAGREKTGDWSWRKVGHVVFEQYHKYLETRNTRHLTQAERKIIDGS